VLAKLKVGQPSMCLAGGSGRLGKLKGHAQRAPPGDSGGIGLIQKIYICYLTTKM